MNMLLLLLVEVDFESTTATFSARRFLFFEVIVTYAPVDSQFPSTCAATSCFTNTICREVLNRTSGVIFAVCFDPVRHPPTGNEPGCSGGQPLWVVNSNGGYSEAACRTVVDRTTCPSGYDCVIAPNDAYSLCCPVKLGQCPVPQPGDVGICGFTCQSDDNCPDVEKCCRTACGGTSCTLPIVTCELLDCAKDKICIDTPTGAKCITPPREGRCPAPRFSAGFKFCRRRCETDAECPGFQKCCPAGFPSRCGTECRDPDPPVTCKTTECPSGEICIMKEVICVRPPCFPVPTCVAKRCPVYPAFVPPGCVPRNTCSRDHNCTSGKLCCATNCGRHCVPPA